MKHIFNESLVCTNVEHSYRAKHLNMKSFKQVMQVSNKHMQIYLTSQIIKNMLNKTKWDAIAITSVNHQYGYNYQNFH